MNGGPVQFSASTIERWYYTARRREGRPGPRPATGRPQGLWQDLPARGRRSSSCWPSIATTSTGATSCTTTTWPPGSRPSRRWGRCVRIPRCGGTCRLTAGSASGGRRPRAVPARNVAAQRRERREIRSYEAEYVGSLWHLDFHHGSLPVLLPSGQWQRPLALGILDDCSRLGCHLQWYLSETAEDLVHGFSQAIQKRGLPRSTDDRRRLGDDRRGSSAKGCCTWGSSTRRRLPYSPVPEREAGAFLGDPGRPPDGDAGGREGTDAGVPQRSHPGLGRDGVQPGRASGVGLFAGRTFRQDARRAASQSVQ